MTEVTYQIEKNNQINPIPIQIKNVETSNNQPFNYDGFIELIANEIVKDLTAEK